MAQVSPETTDTGVRPRSTTTTTLEQQVADKVLRQKGRPPKQKMPMRPMPKRPKTPGMTRKNRGPF